MPSPLGEKIRKLRKEKGLSLDQLAVKTDSSKSYLWELESRDAPNPSIDKIAKIAEVLGVTPDFLMDEVSQDPNEEMRDLAFFRKYKGMSDTDKKKLRKIVENWEDD